jgi:hypothetical protein
VAEDVDRLRSRLAARRDDCLDRLADVVSELYLLHSLGREEIVAHVQMTIDLERSAPVSDPAHESDDR